MLVRLWGEGSEALEIEECNLPTQLIRSIDHQICRHLLVCSRYYPHSLDNLCRFLDLELWWTYQANSTFVEQTTKRGVVKLPRESGGCTYWLLPFELYDMECRIILLIPHQNISSWRSVVSRKFFKEDHRRVEEESSRRSAMLNKAYPEPVPQLPGQ